MTIFLCRSSLKSGSIVCVLFIALTIQTGLAGTLWEQVGSKNSDVFFLRNASGSFSPCASMAVLTDGDLAYSKPFLHNELATMSEFVCRETQNRLEIYPGSIIAFKDSIIKLDLGRIRLVATAAPLIADVHRGIFELASGSALIETNPLGDVDVALESGNGWLKFDDRSIKRLSAGKELHIPKYGKIGKSTEISSRWNKPPEFWMLPLKNNMLGMSEVASTPPHYLASEPEETISK